MALRHIVQFIIFYREAGGFSKFDGDVEGPAEEIAFQRSVHRRLFVISAMAGLAGVLIGVWLMIGGMQSMNAPGRAARGDEGLQLLLAPVVFGIWGLLLGASIACATAPSRFLMGPAGRKWMALVGTESTFAARIVCWLVIVVFGALPIVVAGLLWWRSVQNG